MIYVLGIDNGVSGAATLMDIEGSKAVSRLVPTVRKKTGPKKHRTRYDLRGIWRLIAACTPKEDLPTRLQHLSNMAPGDKVYAYLEAGTPMPRKSSDETVNEGSVANFRNGVGTGLWQGILTGLQIPYQLVVPRSWQAAMLPGIKGRTKLKAASVDKALDLYPAIVVTLKGPKGGTRDGVADATLIAEYGRLKLREIMDAQGGEPSMTEDEVLITTEGLA